ncbi:hypothetical protein DSO57_1035317 [Entomophthora muscae]|uniref:Uncharacterized protein n=1 Tax=Entomophthora muscae TaxID=34485 RepID=A0ACC2TMD9_9FUNG|nr:hypothetical protein DSO57_1035317 [Entomophthora muscae]
MAVVYGGITFTKTLPYHALNNGIEKYRFDYSIHKGSRWSGGSGDFRAAHEISSGVPASECYRSGETQFCLSEINRKISFQWMSPQLIKESNFWNTFTIKGESNLSNTVKLSEIPSFNIPAFFTENKYNNPNNTCWDVSMSNIRAYTKPVNAWLGRFHLSVSFRLDIFPPNFALPNSTKFYGLKLPISLEDGRCSSIYGIE